MDRLVEREAKTSGEVRYAITSLGEEVGPDQVRKHVRGHWGIENRLHYARDVTEDASQVRKGSMPEVLAALRNVVLALLRRRGGQNVAAALREHGWRPNGALHFLGLAPARVEE